MLLNTTALASSIIEGSASIRLSISPLLTNWRRLRTISLARNACSAASSVASCAVRKLTCPPACKQPLRRIDRIDDRRERLADFVRESGGHLTGGCEACCMKKLILQFLKAQIGLLAFKLLRDESFVDVCQFKFSFRYP